MEEAIELRETRNSQKNQYVGGVGCHGSVEVVGSSGEQDNMGTMVRQDAGNPHGDGTMRYHGEGQGLGDFLFLFKLFYTVRHFYK